MTVTTLNGQVLGEAEHATRSLLDRLLSANGTTFHQWVGLNLIATSATSISRDEFVHRMVHGLKVDEWMATSTIADLIDAGLMGESRSQLTLTEAGFARHDLLRQAIGGITARLYAGLPADDLATAGRVLSIITERANAELA